MSSVRLSAQGTVNRGLSPEIWQSYGFLEKRAFDPSSVGFFFDDFELWPQLASGNTVSYSCYLDTGCTINQYTVVDASEGEWGVIRLSQDGTDNDQISLQLGGGKGGILKIDPTSAAEDNQVVAFECRLRQSSVANTLIKWFAGFAQEGVSKDNGVLADAGNTLSDIDMIGFWVDEADGDDCQFVYQKASGTFVAVHDVATLTASTWTKFGFVYDPNGPSTAKIKTYVDGSEVVAGRVTDATTNGTGDTTNFPGGEEMSPIVLMKIGAGTSCSMDLDWLAAGVAWTDY